MSREAAGVARRPVPRNLLVGSSALLLVGSSALLLILLWLVLYPLLLVLVEGVRSPEGWTLQHVREFAARPTEWQALRGSVVISVASVGW